MLRKLRSYLRRRKCYIISLSACMVILFMLAFNNQIEKFEVYNDDLEGGIKENDAFTPMRLLDVRIPKKDDSEFLNNHFANKNHDEAKGVNFLKPRKNVMFVRLNDDANNNGVDKIVDENNGNKEIEDNRDNNDGDAIEPQNDKQEPQHHPQQRLEDKNHQDDGVSKGGELEKQQHENQQQKQQQENINKTHNAAAPPVPPKGTKPPVLQTWKWFGNLSESGQKAHDAVFAALREDQKNTYEVDLPNLDIKDPVSYPEFIEFGKDGDPGEQGESVKDTVQWDKKEEERKAEYTINQFNLFVSKKISLHRTVKDIRRPACITQEYENPSTFPTVSVVLVFHDEAWTTLLRSVHSIIDRTPGQALLEIVLLDDNSDQPFLGRPLEQYLKPLKIVRLIRSKERLGLIKARNLGFLYARGEIVVFLDSHIECFPGWLEPLVVPIMKDPRTVTFPVIPNISKDNFGINQPKPSTVGSVRIHTMTFKWMDVGLSEEYMYYKSPTMPGGLYAISRDWFRHLGAYDPELLYWGGENLEISFKTWMCGGSIQAAACSYVGHVFRRDSPFHFDGFSKAIQRNLLRVADIWMDEFKHFYLEKFTYIIDPFGDTSLQRQLRESLQCHSFRWYIDNVNKKLKKEMDADGIYSGQVWQFRTDGTLSMYDKMMKVVKNDPHDGTVSYRLTMDTQNVDEMAKFAVFKYDENRRLLHTNTGLCMDIEDTPTMKKVILATCGDSPNQKWKIQTRQELQKYHKDRGVTGIVW